ncbi:MAG TPA: adenylate/guanylate cyclase domain-containing protein [Candidatus Binatia bacterium]|nr:adenylate/guanylate cyclase domain-containing protein [Candidatus Binatia bacterium]
MKSLWLSLLLARIGQSPNETEEERLLRLVGVVSLLVGGTFVLLLCGCYWLFDEVLAASIAFLYLIMLLTSGVLWSYGVLGLYQWAWLMRVLALLNPFLSTWLLGGLINSGLVATWGSFALLSTLVYAPRRIWLWILAYLALLAFTVLAQPLWRPTNNFPQPVITFMVAFNVGGTAVLSVIAMAYFVNQKNIFQAKADQLLLSILPKEIASILKNENHIIANYHHEVSILFADVVDFTPMSAAMTPLELVELLNEVFSYFDTLAEKYGLEKIKTIGDCYMVASGVPRSHPGHAQALVRMALEMRDHVAQHAFSGRRLAFRIGINSGPVVAGIIGRRKFIYDLWGDTVNTASRMESHGHGGSIQITEATYELIKNEFVCNPGGVKNVKGKGEMKVWFVLGPKGEPCG